MKFKIISHNEKLKQKALLVFNILNMKEGIHIQDIDFWLIDVQTIDEEAFESYNNRKMRSFLLFVVNNDNDVKKILQHGFTNYIQYTFSNEELKNWYHYFQKSKKPHIIHINNNIHINFNTSQITMNSEHYTMTQQELLLLKCLSHKEFVATHALKSLLNLNSTTSVRTLINRIKKKIGTNIFVQKRNYGYKLNGDTMEKKEIQPSNEYIKELEEQNALIQKIVDNSSVYIATFVHKQLFCINKAFRDLLGNDIIKELWQEEKGDFFQLIQHDSKDTAVLKETLFNSSRINYVKIYNFKSHKNFEFAVQTYFFKQLDKHLLIFS